jgi:DNA polymerase (family 10)
MCRVRKIGVLNMPISNSEIADRLTSLAQLLSPGKENFYRVKAYQRAAARIRSMSESIDELVRDEADLTEITGIGSAIAAAIREIVLTGKLGRLEKLRAEVSRELTDISNFPRLDPRKVMRIYKRMKISSIDSLREKLESGELQASVGPRLAQHIRQGLAPTQALLLYKADPLAGSIEHFLLDKCHVRRAEAVGAYRRRVEVIDELEFLIQTDNFPNVIATFGRYGGDTPLLQSSTHEAVFTLSAGVLLRVHVATSEVWGRALIQNTGSSEHLQQLPNIPGQFASEDAFYKEAGLEFIPPELREGHDEVERAKHGTLPDLISLEDLQGELHAHSLSSDGSASIEDMVAAAKAHGYDYIGMSDHSQSLKIANGVSEEDLWKQIRYIDRLNQKLDGIHILKSSEVDILADGKLDYPDELLKELDYTVCSIHSRFGLGKAAQTERIMRAMDNRYFNILGHATGRLLLKRPGYEIDLERIIEHAKANGCFFEINSSPDRLDLSADNARLAANAGVKLAISTDAHGIREFQLSRYGVDQARRAGVAKNQVLNAEPWEKLLRSFAR